MFTCEVETNSAHFLPSRCRLEGNGDRVQADCTGAASWAGATLMQPAESWWFGPAPVPLTLHLHSACAHPATVTLEVGGSG